jgi:tetratricopeptide (TPR) repeat protein
MEDRNKTPLNIAYCYASEDEALRYELDKHLSILKHQGLIITWQNSEILAGSEFKLEKEIQLNKAKIILLLISSDFLNSDYCYSIEMRHALQRHSLKDAKVISILLRAVDWKDAPFSILPTLPINHVPITSWQNRDEAFAEVTREVRRLVTEFFNESFLNNTSQKIIDTTASNRSAANTGMLLSAIAELYNSSGNKYCNREQYQKALLAYEQAIGLEEKDNFIINKGDTLYNLKHYSEALATYTRVINGYSLFKRYEDDYEIVSGKARPKDIEIARAYEGMGKTLYELGRYVEALYAYDYTLELCSDNPETYFNKGLALSEIKSFLAAIANYEKAINLNPYYELAYYHKDLALQQIEKSKETEEAIKQAHQFGYKGILY